MAQINLPRPVLSTLAAVLCCAVLVTGCEYECPPVHDCDIRQRDCQRDIMATAACLRGGEVQSVPVEVVEAEQFVDERVAERTDSVDDESIRRRNLALSLFELVPSGLTVAAETRAYWDDIAAFFFSDTGKVTVLDRGSPLDTTGYALLLLHEFIHALQDVYPGFDRLDEQANGSFDKSLAIDSITEGEAVLYQDLAGVTALGWETDEVDWDRVYTHYRLQSAKDARASDAPLLDAWKNFSYAFGGSYVYDAWQDGGQEAVLDLYQDLPLSTRQIMSGYGAEEIDGGPWLEEFDDVALPVVPEEFEYLAAYRIGAFLFEDFAARMGGQKEWQAHERFRGDVLTLFFAPVTDDALAVWRVRWSLASVAERAVEKITAGLARRGIAVWRIEDEGKRDTAILASTRQELPEQLQKQLEWEALPVEAEDPKTDAAGSPRRYRDL